ncbi:MAG: hypothetical protein H0U42_03685 [Thermoleophilaceae bacterium]|nr:hypothetical protein [Thermoleophilaceae bacterium]
MLRRLASITPGLKLLPIVRIIAIAEVAVLAGKHFARLDSQERSRLFWLIRRPRSLTPDQKVELRALVAKLEPRLFAGLVLDKLSPVPLPDWVTGAKDIEVTKQPSEPAASPPQAAA